jgi:hypothetical protein
MQQQILEHLADPILTEENGGRRSRVLGRKHGEVEAFGHNFIPGDGVCDLRHVLWVLANRHDDMMEGVGMDPLSRQSLGRRSLAQRQA